MAEINLTGTITKEKTLTGSINKGIGMGNVSAEELAAAVETYMAANPPEALTFTGAVEATYDGSEAVSVEIPQGGGEKEWEILCDHELTEEATIKLTFDATKDEYLCLILVPKVEATISTNAASFLGAQSNIYYSSIGSSAYPAMVALYSQMIGEDMQRQVYVHILGPTVFTPSSLSAKATPWTSVHTADRTKGLCIPATLPIGTKVRVYGR